MEGLTEETVRSVDSQGPENPEGMCKTQEVFCWGLMRPGVTRKLLLVVSWEEGLGWLRTSWLKGKIGATGQTDYHMD